MRGGRPAYLYAALGWVYDGTHVQQCDGGSIRQLCTDFHFYFYYDKEREGLSEVFYDSTAAGTWFFFYVAALFGAPSERRHPYRSLTFFFPF